MEKMWHQLEGVTMKLSATEEALERRVGPLERLWDWRRRRIGRLWSNHRSRVCGQRWRTGARRLRRSSERLWV
jgi:hypothetical protein